ncbi:polyketide synthase [Apiospora sp. TS-2023a]
MGSSLELKINRVRVMRRSCRANFWPIINSTRKRGFFNTPILEDVYTSGTGSQLGYSYIVNYLDRLAHNNINLSILDAPTRHGDESGASLRFGRYDFADLYPSPRISFGQIQDAFRGMQGGRTRGRLCWGLMTMILFPQKDLYNFDPTASYLISGVLEGLGRSISRWIAGKGARHLVLLSRSGNTKGSSKALVADLEAISVRVATQPCNVTDAGALKDALDQAYGAGIPPVKGCIQGSVVLKDSLLANMTLEDYCTAVKPKVDASWNLHDVLPKEDLDFFVLMLSISTVWGNRGQANYNIGNAFQDALARHSVRHGWRALAGLEPCGWMNDPLVRALHQIRPRSGDDSSHNHHHNQTVNYGALLVETPLFVVIYKVMYGAIADKLIKSLNITAGDIDPGKSLHDMGVDSLVSVELRTWILKHLDANVAVFDLMEKASIRKLAVLVVGSSGFVVTGEKGEEG